MKHRGIVINKVTKNNIETIYDNRKKNTTLTALFRSEKTHGIQQHVYITNIASILTEILTPLLDYINTYTFA